MDIIKTIGALLTIGITIYSFVAGERKKRQPTSRPTPSEPPLPEVVKPIPVAPPLRKRRSIISPLPPDVSPALPEEGARVTRDEVNPFPADVEEADPDTEELRNAIIWSEILQRKF